MLHLQIRAFVIVRIVSMSYVTIILASVMFVELWPIFYGCGLWSMLSCSDMKHMANVKL